MKLLNLPDTTKVNRVIPKKAFDNYTTPKDRKAFSDKVDKIRWLNKLSLETTNLPYKEIQEIQVFEIRLKSKADIGNLIKVIDKAIPYPIVFLVRWDDEVILSASKKHPNPTNENTSVIDWVFCTDWMSAESLHIQFHLKQDIDFVFEDICKQITGNVEKNIRFEELIEKERKIKYLEKKISKLEQDIARCKQFNLKLDLNRSLREARGELKTLL